jgi:hypothetical protein
LPKANRGQVERSGKILTEKQVICQPKWNMTDERTAVGDTNTTARLSAPLYQSTKKVHPVMPRRGGEMAVIDALSPKDDFRATLVGASETLDASHPAGDLEVVR